MPRMGFSVTPMQLVRQKSLLRSFSATVDFRANEKMEEESELDCALKQAVLRRRKDFDLEDLDQEGIKSPESPWAVEDQF